MIAATTKAGSSNQNHLYYDHHEPHGSVVSSAQLALLLLLLLELTILGVFYETCYLCVCGMRRNAYACFYRDGHWHLLRWSFIMLKLRKLGAASNTTKRGYVPHIKGSQRPRPIGKCGRRTR